MDCNKDKILILSTEDKDGGAVARTMNITNALHSAGYQIALLVKKKYSSLPYVYEVPAPSRHSRMRRVFTRIFGHPKPDICRVSEPDHCVFYREDEMASVYPSDLIADYSPFTPTLVMACLTSEFVNTNTLLELQKRWDVPVLLDAYDMKVFTGACHVVWKCKGFEANCADCPAIANRDRRSEVAESFAIRKKNIDAGKMGVMIASEWSAEKARKSSLFHDKLIFDVGMCTDTDLYNNKNRDIAKRLFDIPEGSKVVFTGSEDIKTKRKGVQYFFKSLETLWHKLAPELREKVYIMLIGRSVEEMQAKVRDLPPFNYKLIPFISDNRLLALAYQAADVFVCSSQEDAGPQMVADALASGTPVVGFPTGIMYDQSCVINGETGYVVENNNVEQMGIAMAKIISMDSKSYMAMSKKCRTIALAKLSTCHTVNQINELDISKISKDTTK